VAPCCARSSRIRMPSPNILGLIVSKISAFILTDRHGYIDAASDSDQKFIHSLGSETFSSTCYILSDESSIHFYSTNNGYKFGYLNLTRKFTNSVVKLVVL